MIKEYPKFEASEDVLKRIIECEQLATKDARLLKTWNMCWETLERLSTNNDTPIKLHLDFAPYSFGFQAGGLVGGFIFHGDHDNRGDGGAPTFSVNISGSYGWSLHT